MTRTMPSLIQIMFLHVVMITAVLLLTSQDTLPASMSSQDGAIYVVRLDDRPGAGERAAHLSAQHNALHRYQHVFHGFSAQLSAAALEALERNPHVQKIEKAHTAHTASEVYPSGVDRIDADLVHAGLQGTGVRVAVVDTGIDFSHPDLAGQVDIGLSRTFVSRGKTTNNGQDDHGHGTHVAGTVAAVLGNDLGVVGVAPQATLIALKVLNKNGFGSSADIIAALDYITGYNNSQSNYTDIIHVANFSLGGSGSDTDSSYRRAFARTVASGCFITVAAGNESDNAANHVPAAYDMVFTVSAMDPRFDSFASFSNYGNDVDITAPGVAIYSTLLGGGYASWNGTSMATPHVAGAAALYISQNLFTLDKTGAESAVRTALIGSGETIALSGDTDGITEPLVDAGALLGPVTPPTPAILMSVSSDKTSYLSSDTRALLTVTVQDEYGTAVTGLSSSNFDLGAFEGNRVSFSSNSGGYTIELDISAFSDDTDYPITVVATNGTLSDSDGVTIRKASAKTIYISAITYEKVFKNLRGYVTVSDLSNVPVSGATVNLTLKRDDQDYKNFSLVTAANGVADFRVGNARTGFYTITILSVTSPGATYDPLLNASDPGYDVP